MPITFTTSTNPAKPPVSVATSIDSEGDAIIEINGIGVAYVSSTDGGLRLLKLSLAERQALEGVGIKFEGNAIYGGWTI